MDRNCWRSHSRLPNIPVALRKESVDRNAAKMKVGGIDVSSLSARRAWIEIIECSYHNIKLESLSARRAWIEMSSVATLAVLAILSLSARRAWIEIDRAVY